MNAPPPDISCFDRNRAEVEARVEAACQRWGRPRQEVGILPVTKTFPLEVWAWVRACGWRAVGENRVQEAVRKVDAWQASTGTLGEEALRCELIGHLQSNKAAQAVRVCHRVQTVDTLRLAERLDRACAEAGRSRAVLVHVNTGRETAKHGGFPAGFGALVDGILHLPRLRLEGLMTIAPLDPDPSLMADLASRAFSALREEAERLRLRTGRPLAELSMGMSGDLEEAVREGSTLLRLGSALFGDRPLT